tara:strand:- start:212 stop:496 length:285 start_codon:yes stop_codon:yes gene_type:complete
LPGVAMVTSSLPLVAFVPDQVPVAVHEVALVEDQVKVTGVSINTDEEELERDEVGLGSGAGEPPPPPPPPQETTKRKIKDIDINLFEKEVKCFK